MHVGLQVSKPFTELGNTGRRGILEGNSKVRVLNGDGNGHVVGGLGNAKRGFEVEGNGVEWEGVRVGSAGTEAY